MTDATRLERRYRRLLLAYPRAFRREHEEEILAVLLSDARDGQRRPGLAASADLLTSGLWMRIVPRVPRSAGAVRAAARLMCVGALVTVFGLVAAAGALGAGVHASLRVAGHPQPVPATVTVGVVVGLVEVALWLWMARANSQGRSWARVLSTVLVAGATLHLFSSHGVAQGAFNGGTWLLGVAAVSLLWRPGSAEFFRPDRPSDPVHGV